MIKFEKRRLFLRRNCFGTHVQWVTHVPSDIVMWPSYHQMLECRRETTKPKDFTFFSYNNIFSSIHWEWIVNVVFLNFECAQCRAHRKILWTTETFQLVSYRLSLRRLWRLWHRCKFLSVLDYRMKWIACNAFVCWLPRLSIHSSSSRVNTRPFLQTNEMSLNGSLELEVHQKWNKKPEWGVISHRISFIRQIHIVLDYLTIWW